MNTVAQTLDIAVRHHQAGNLQQAEQGYRQILQVDPNNVNALHLLGLIALHVGKLDSAVDLISQAVRIKPDFAEAHGNLGIALQQRGQLAEATASWRYALSVNPNYVGAYYHLGAALYEQGKFEEAVATWRQAVNIKPDYAEAHNSLGVALHELGRTDEALTSWRQALHYKPDYAEAYSNLGGGLKHQKQLDEAVACYQQALHLKPDFAEAHNNLGTALKETGKIEEAAARYKQALQLKPNYAAAHHNLAGLLGEQGDLEAANASYQRALEVNPDDVAALGALVFGRQQMCEWENLQGLSQRMIEIVDSDAGVGTPVSPGYFLCLSTATTPAQQGRCARQWAARQLKAISAPSHARAPQRTLDHKSKLTIGYVSADFYAHPVAYLIAELFEKHNRDQFNVFGYSYSPDDASPIRRRIVGAFDRFAELKEVPPRETARRMEADGIDILVDLMGYTRYAPTQIFASRSAPIQVNFLGYPCTMGAPFMDYILVDDFVVPSEQQPFFTEQLVHLPGCYQVNDSQREIAPHTPSRAECGLPEEGFVFCCFNNIYKITPVIFAVWMRLLKALPGSVLWLLEGNRFAPANLRREARAAGVAEERLVFAPRRPLPDHLARHRAADLFLDCFPYNAHTTASDALWAGCPLLTITGETFISRVAGSLLRTMGLPDLITTSLEEYQANALRLAHNPDLLADVRGRLEANRQPCGLFDGARFARNLEKAYVKMQEIHVSGEKPRPFAVSPS